MSETVNETVEPAQDAEIDWKAEARKWEARAKENHAALGKATEALKSHEDAKLSELERAQAEAKAAQEQLAQLQRETLIARVANDKGLPPELSPFLTGSDEASLIEQADLLASRLKPQAPKPDPSQGGQSNTAEPSESQEFLAGLFGS